MTDDGTDLVKTGVGALAEGTTRAFIETLLGPAVEGGAWLTDQVRFLRWKSQVKMIDRARTFLDDRGIEPHRIPVKTLLPLIEGAGLEDESDDEMIDRWARLLANAAASGAAGVTSSYAAILREIGTAEAVLVDWLYDPANDPPVPEVDAQGWMISQDVAGIRTQLGASEATFAVVAENVIRLGLAARAWRQAGANLGGAGADIIPVNDQLARTALGAAFVNACTRVA